MKILFKSFIIVLILVISTVMFISCDKDEHVDSVDNFEFILKNSLDGKNPRIVDVAMLGAHDTFSMHINDNSKPNIHEDGIFNNPTIRSLGKKLITNFSKAQNEESTQLYNKGVRYLDIRLTLIDNTYYTCHGVISDTFEKYLKELLTFLQTHPGEFFILDFQHFYTEYGQDYDLADEHWKNLFEFIGTIKVDGMSLFDYVYYDSSNQKISQLHYNDVTINSTKAGVVLLAPNKSLNEAFYRDCGAYDGYDGYKNIRSKWHNNLSYKIIYNGALTECDYIEEKIDIYKDLLRVNQFVATPFSNNALKQTIDSESLIKIGEGLNQTLLNNEEDFYRMIRNMPILMVDVATSDMNDFNKIINNRIMKYNKNLNS